MRVLVLLGVAVIVVATATLVDVSGTPDAALSEPRLALPLPLASYLIYGVGLALLLFTAAAHVGLAKASRHILRGGRAGPFASALVLSGLVVLGEIAWWAAGGYGLIVPEERVRYLLVASITTAHLTVTGLLLVALGLRIARLRPAGTASLHAPAGAARRR